MNFEDYHINLLKNWKDQEAWMISLYPDSLELGPLGEQRSVIKKDSSIPMRTRKNRRSRYNT